MIGWRDGEDRLHRGSLFAAFAALARGEAWSFPALRSHQREPWHAFAVQVAALALIRAGSDALPQDEAAWRDLLLALTPGQPEAWELVVDDWSRPALLQPPAPQNANLKDYKLVETPDALDILVTSKNHDVKTERLDRASDEEWLFSLITLQTYQGYSGRSPPTQFFHGISRMNGGSASRMSLSVRPYGGAGRSFCRDVRRLVETRSNNTDRFREIALLWMLPWNGRDSLDYQRLDELYVEICRRIRLRRVGAGLKAFQAPSEVTRVTAKGLNGKTEDPWTPIKADGSSSVSPSNRGFGYWQMAQLLDANKVTAPLLARPHPDDDPTGLSLVAAALVRGQGKTEGLHRRAIRTWWEEGSETYGDPEVLDRVGDVARARADQASSAAGQLRRALILLVQGGPDQARLDDDAAKKKVKPWVDGFDDRVDAEFFERPFWDEVADRESDRRLAWRERLRTIARETLAAAEPAAPRTEMRRIRAIARARTMLEAQMSKWLKEVA